MSKVITYEFRVFFPATAADAADSTTNAEYIDALKAVQAQFNNSNEEEDSAPASVERIKMVYIVGCDHWGAKYRGVKEKLEVKYRTHVASLGSAQGVLEAFKKKDYKGAKLGQMRAKLLEKLSKHCGAEQHTIEQEQLSAQAIDANRLCSMTKTRIHISHGGASIELALLDVEPVAATATATATANITTIQWVSVAVEGTDAEIDSVVKSSFFEPIARALRAGLALDLPLLVGGYPTFAVNMNLLNSSSSSYSETENEKKRQREQVQRDQVAQLLAYL
jgi:hypothetical protein